MAGVYSTDVTDRDEILLIPHFRSHVPLSSAKPPAYFAQQLSTQLLNLRRDALVDPSGLSDPGKVLRFTSKAAFAFWVLAGWLRGGEAAVAVSKALGGGSVAEWQRKHVLNDARMLVKLVGALARAGLAARWAGQLTARDVALATPQLAQAFRVSMRIWELERENPLAAASSKGSSLHGHARQSDAPYSPPKSTPSLAAQPPAFSIAPIIAAARQAGNDIANLDEPARRLLAVTLALSASPNIGPRLDRVDWKLAFQSSQTDFRAADMPPDMPASQPAERTSKAATITSDTRSRRAKPDVVQRATLRVGRGTEDAPAEQQAPQDVNVPLATAQIVHTPTTLTTRAGDADGGAALEFSTGFGGIFFLVNVFTALDLYPDFTRPLDKGLEVSPFWLLDRLALRMFGVRYRSDPLHRWLSGIGRGGTLPDYWTVEIDWLTGIGQPTRVSSHHSQRRTTYWDACGFALLDLPDRHAHRMETTRPWHRRARSGGKVPGLLRRLPSERSARWVACLAAFIEFRLGMATSGLSSSLLQMPAQVRIREDSVLVQFALASLPMSIRMAGLDRNPSWLPTEGRDLMFEFK